MYKYKFARYIFRIFNLFIYAAIASFAGFSIMNGIYVSHIMDSIFNGYSMDAKRCIHLAAFLIGNMLFILFFKLISNEKREALLYYICDFVIRLTFSLPLAFIVFYFLLYRFCGVVLITAASQVIVFIILFALFDYLMRLQIKYQLGVNYFKIYDKV